jgi:hypothetical protein
MLSNANEVPTADSRSLTTAHQPRQDQVRGRFGSIRGLDYRRNC